MRQNSTHRPCKKISNLVKLGDQELPRLTLSLPKIPESKTEAPVIEGPQLPKDEIVQDVLANISSRNKQNASHIIENILKSSEVASWNDNSEFVFKGKSTEGYHMVNFLNLKADQSI